jgi:hypothetical protein
MEDLGSTRLSDDGERAVDGGRKFDQRQCAARRPSVPQLLEQKDYQQELKPLLVRSISSLIPSLTGVEVLRRQLMLDIQTLVEVAVIVHACYQMYCLTRPR